MNRRRTIVTLLAVLAALVVGLACAEGGPPADPGTPPPPQPVITGFTLIYPPDLRTPLAQVPWCADHHGNSPVYPCKWDLRERPAPGWDPQVPPVAIWVLRSPTACVDVTKIIKISEKNDVGFNCYYAPGS